MSLPFIYILTHGITEPIRHPESMAGMPSPSGGFRTGSRALSAGRIVAQTAVTIDAPVSQEVSAIKYALCSDARPDHFKSQKLSWALEDMGQQSEKASERMVYFL